MGRKPANRRHTADLRIRLLEEHKQLIVEAAEHAGISVSDWTRLHLIRVAREELGRNK